MPDKEWLEEKFPGENWDVIPYDVFITLWLTAVHGWERLAKQWDTENYSSHQPIYSALLPVGGLMAVLGWSQERGRAKQKELIGMTKADEQDVYEIWDTFNQIIAIPDDTAAA